MKIAIVSPYISSSKNLEYYQSQQINLAAELIKLRLQVDIITAQRHPEKPGDCTMDRQIRIFRLPIVSKWAERFLKQPIMSGLWKQLRKENYDFVQSSEDYSISTLIAGLYALLNKSRLIIYQGIYDYSSKKIVKTFMVLYDLIIGAILRRSYCVAVCKTNRAGRHLQRKEFVRTQIIPIGVNTSLFYPGTRETRERFELLAVGNLISLKNYALILEVFHQLVGINPNVRLTIIGSGPEKEQIENFVRENRLADRFRLLENIPNSQMRKYYAQADLLLLFSKIEIFGMVILEAMACGCPVISTPTAGAVDVITNGVNGFIISDVTPAKIASRIAQIFAAPAKLEGIREEAVRTAQEKYSWPVIAKQYYDLYFEKANC